MLQFALSVSTNPRKWANSSRQWFRASRARKKKKEKKKLFPQIHLDWKVCNLTLVNQDAFAWQCSRDHLSKNSSRAPLVSGSPRVPTSHPDTRKQCCLLRVPRAPAGEPDKDLALGRPGQSLPDLFMPFLAKCSAVKLQMRSVPLTDVFFENTRAAPPQQWKLSNDYFSTETLYNIFCF